MFLRLYGFLSAAKAIAWAAVLLLLILMIMGAQLGCDWGAPPMTPQEIRSYQGILNHRCSLN